MVERLRLDYFKNEHRVPNSLVVGIRVGDDLTQKNHTTSFPKWKYVETEEKGKVAEDALNLKTMISCAMGIFKKEVDLTKVQ